MTKNKEQARQTVINREGCRSGQRDREGKNCDGLKDRERQKKRGTGSRK